MLYFRAKSSVERFCEFWTIQNDWTIEPFAMFMGPPRVNHWTFAMLVGPPRLNHLSFCNVHGTALTDRLSFCTVHGTAPIEPFILLQYSWDRSEWTVEPFAMFIGPPRLNHLSFCNVHGTALIELFEPFVMFMGPPWLNHLAICNVHGTAPNEHLSLLQCSWDRPD